jgi:hypothetical protein
MKVRQDEETAAMGAANSLRSQAKGAMRSGLISSLGESGAEHRHERDAVQGDKGRGGASAAASSVPKGAGVA